MTLKPTKDVKEYEKYGFKSVKVVMAKMVVITYA